MPKFCLLVGLSTYCYSALKCIRLFYGAEGCNYGELLHVTLSRIIACPCTPEGRKIRFIYLSLVRSNAACIMYTIVRHTAFQENDDDGCTIHNQRFPSITG